MCDELNYPIIDEVYATLQGDIAPCFAIPGVENAFDDGAKCALLYSEVYDAERRLEERLGVPPYDKDVEKIISALCNIQKYLCFKMYYYGATIGLKPTLKFPEDTE